MIMTKGGILIILTFGRSLAWDGCKFHSAWKCGDQCIFSDSECNCGGIRFNRSSPLWCCEDSSCFGRGTFINGFQAWTGELSSDGYIGANCTGTVLSLREPCRDTCNYHPEDKSRNHHNVLRSHMPCSVAQVRLSQCIPEQDVRDGKFDCENRADEEPFETSYENSSTLLVDMSDILRDCTGKHGEVGFKCSGNNLRDDCLSMYSWCNPGSTFTCNELEGKTATGKTIDPVMCSNQSFWEHQGCNKNRHFYRCTAETPGQCNIQHRGCVDASHTIKPPQGGDCGGDIRCKGREFSRWKNLEVCIEKQYMCDGTPRP